MKMPLIVRRCIQSVIRHSNGYKVVLITKNNIRYYTNIPRYIYHKLYNNEITLTHFSDILRFNLLANNGGLWIDSTFYCSSDFSSDYFGDIYVSGGYSYKQSSKLYFSKWTEALIGGNKYNSIFKFLNNFLMLYWKYNSVSIDYFLADYALMYVYKHDISHFKYYVDNKAYKNNPHLYYLVDYLNKPYDRNIYKKITKDTNLFKLTYKKKFNNNNDTFYHRLINYKL